MTRRILTLDPTLFVLSFATWALFQGITLAGPGEAFQLGASYSVIRQLPITEDAWGWALLADAGVLALSAFRGPPALRAGIAALSCGVWMAFGGLLMAGGYRVGVFSAVGAFSFVGGLGLGAATGQWAAGDMP